MKNPYRAPSPPPALPWALRPFVLESLTVLVAFAVAAAARVLLH